MEWASVRGSQGLAIRYRSRLPLCPLLRVNPSLPRRYPRRHRNPFHRPPSGDPCRRPAALNEAVTPQVITSKKIRRSNPGCRRLNSYFFTPPDHRRHTPLWVSGDYLSDVELLRITPDPVSQESASNGVRYRFHLAAEMWLDGKPTIIVEHGRPKMDVMTLARVDERDVAHSSS